MQALVEDLSAMNTAKKTHIQPGGFIVPAPRKDDGMLNDSPGTTDVADSTGNDPEKETGDAKTENHNTCKNWQLE